MIENQNAGVTQKKKKYGRLKGFICFFVAAFISFSQVSPIWAAEGTRVFDEAGLFSAEEVQELETRIASGTMRVVFCFRSIWTTGRYTFLPPGMR